MSTQALATQSRFYLGCFFEHVKEGFHLSIPIISAIDTVKSLAHHLNPVLFPNKDERTGHFISSSIQIKPLNISDEKKQIIENYQQQLDKWNAKFKTAVKLRIKDEDDSTYSYGDGSSYSGENAYITIPINSFLKNKNAEEVDQWFVFASEFINIVENNHIKTSSALLATAILTNLVWCCGCEEGMPVEQAGYTAMNALGVGVIASVANGVFFRNVPEQRDRKVMELLGTNRGALAFFEAMKKKDKSGEWNGYLEQRIKYAKEWKPNS